MFSPDPVGLAHAARLFIGGPSHGQSLLDPCASLLTLTTPPQTLQILEGS